MIEKLNDIKHILIKYTNKMFGTHSYKEKQTIEISQTVHKRELIPNNVKIFVWNRDKGKCVQCESNEKLEYDHIIPIIKGGSSTGRNIQLLCEKCNRSKGSSIA